MLLVVLLMIVVRLVRVPVDDAAATSLKPSEDNTGGIFAGLAAWICRWWNCATRNNSELYKVDGTISVVVDNASLRLLLLVLLLVLQLIFCWRDTSPALTNAAGRFTKGNEEMISEREVWARW